MIPIDNKPLLTTVEAKDSLNSTLPVDFKLIFNALAAAYQFAPTLKAEPSTLEDAEVYKEFSVLQKPLNMSCLRSLDRTLFAHINNESDISETDLEGMSSTEATSFFCKFLKEWLKDAPLSGGVKKKFEIIQKLLEESVALHSQGPQAIAKKIHGLKSGERFVMLGGTKTHAMLYEFIKRENGNYDLLIYNTGDGSEFHDRIFGKSRDLASPVVKFEDVLPEEIGFSKETPYFEFIERLSRFEKEQSPVCQASDIYKKAFGHLSNKRVHVARAFDDFMTPARAGVCAWDVLCGFTRVEVGDVSAYKYWAHAVKFITTVAYFNQVKDHLDEITIEASSDRLLLKRSAEAQMRNVAKLLGKEFVKESQMILGTLWELKQYVEKAERGAFQSLQSQHRPVGDHQGVSFSKSELAKILDEFSKPPSQSTPLPPLVMPRPSEFHDMDTLQKGLAGFLEELKKTHSQKEFFVIEAIPALIDHFVDSLPLPESKDWDSLSVDELKPLVSQFHTLFELYANHTLRDEMRSVKQVNTALHLFAIMHRLSQRIEVELYKNQDFNEFGIFLEPFKDHFSRPETIYYQEIEWKKTVALQSYLENLGNKQTLFDNHLINQTAFDNPNRLMNLPDYQFLVPIAQRSQTVIGAIKSQEQEFIKTYENKDYWFAAALFNSVGDFALDEKTRHIHRYYASGALLQFFSGNSLYSSENASHFRSMSFQLNPMSSHLSDVNIFFRLQFGDITEGLSHYKQPFFEKAKRKDKHGEVFFLEKWCERDSEGRYLRNMSRNKTTKLQPLSISQAKSKLQPAKILQYFLENIDLLSEKDNRLWFEILLFSTHPNKSSQPDIVTLNEWASNPHFVQQTLQLIEKGLFIYYLNQSGERPVLGPALFFVRLANWMRNNLSDQKIPFSEQLFEKWLERPDLNAFEKSAIHLHRLHYFAMRPKEKYSPEEAAKIMESWLFYCHKGLPQDAILFEVESVVKEFIFLLFLPFRDQFFKRSGWLNEILTKTLVQSGIVSTQDPLVWEHQSEFTFTAKTPDDLLTIDLLSGAITNRMGTINPALGDLVKRCEGEETKRLFGQLSDYEMAVSNGYLEFIHPKLGAIRLLPKEYTNGDPTIYRLLDGKWHQYLPATIVQEKFSNLPLTLLADHSHWFPAEQMPTTLIATPTKGGEKYYRITSNKVERITGKKVEEVMVNDKNCFVHIERPEAVYWIDTTCHFDRFLSIGGRPLRLTQSDPSKGLRWEENPNFVLAEEQPQGLLLTAPNYLYFRDIRASEGKLLVPMVPVSNTDTFSSVIELDVHDAHRHYEIPDCQSPQKGIYTILEFDLHQGSPVPLNQEGTLFLAYLYFAQRKYQKALEYLRQISPAATLTLKSHQIIQWILERATKTASDGAFQLQVISLVQLINRRPDLPEKNRFSLDSKEDQKRLNLINHQFLQAKATVPYFLKEGLDQGRDRTGSAVVWQEADPPEVKVGFDRYSRTSVRLVPSLVEFQYGHSYRYAFKGNYSLVSEHFSASPSNLSFEKGLLSSFGYFYTLAKKCQTQDEKTLLAVRIASVPPIEGEPALSGDLQTFLLFTLWNPSLAPDLFSEEDMRYRTISWLCTLAQTYDKFTDSNLSHTYGSKAQEMQFQAAFPSPLALDITPSRAHEEIVLLDPMQVASHPFKELVEPFFEKTHPFKSADVPKLSFSYSPTESERPYEKVILQEALAFQTELNVGAKENAKRTVYLPKNPDLSKLKGELERLLKEYSNEQQQLKVLIEKLLNRPSINNEKERLLKLTGTEGNSLEHRGIEGAINLWFLQDLSEYIKFNPELTSKEAIDLDHLITRFLVSATDKQLVERSLGHLRRYEKEEDLSKKGIHANKAASELAAPLIIDPQQDRVLRVIEYRDNIRIREKQERLIRNFLKEGLNGIGQLLMGMGKTTVAASALLFKWAVQGRISAFMGPEAQFETLKNNLVLAQRKFGMRVIPISLKREEMTTKNLRWVKESMERAKLSSHGECILWDPKMVPFLLLESLCLFHQGIQDEKKLFLMLDILKMMREDQKLLIDEFDLFGNPRVETNFVVGLPDNVKPSYILLMRALFEEMLTHPDICKKLNLRNSERNFDPRFYFDTGLKILATSLHHYPEMLLEEEDYESFDAYITGQMGENQKERKALNELIVTGQSSEEKCLPKAHVEFLKKLHSFGHSHDQAQKDAANLIAVAKYCLQKILPMVLSRSVGVNTGWRGILGVPYSHVDSPTNCQYANVFEALASQFLIAVTEGDKSDRGIHGQHIGYLAEQMKAAAKIAVEENNESFEKTPEAVNFELMTGISFTEIELPGRLEQARRNVCNDVIKILDIQTEICASSVKFFSKFFNANSQTFIDLLTSEGGSTVHGMSGTPWDLPAYHKSLLANLCLDQGTEGQIAHVMLTRWSQNPHFLHEIPSVSVDHILDAAYYSNPRREQIHALIDGGGLLQTYANETVARRFLEKVDGHIEAVLFYGRTKEQSPDDPPDSLMVFKRGNKKVQVIGSTDPVELRKAGIDPEKTFVFFDQRHCEATNIPLPATALCLMTFDPKMNRRTQFQAALRSREYFEKQDLELVILAESKPHVMNQGSSPSDFVMTPVKNQAAEMGEDAYRSTRHRLHAEAFKFVIEQFILGERNLKKLQGIFDTYRKFLVSEIAIHPLRQFGLLEEEINVQELLVGYSKGVLEQLGKKEERVERGCQALLQEAADSPFMPKTLFTTPADADVVPTDLHLHAEVEQAVEQNVDIALDQELNQELKVYQSLRMGSVRQEQSLKNMDIEKLPEGSSILPLPSMLALYKDYLAPYPEIFDTNIFVTENWIYTVDSLLPLFHCAHKPPHHILVIQKEGGMQFMFLSAKEADHMKKHLKKQMPQNMWLILSSGAELSAHTHASLSTKEKKQLKRALLQANFMDGNALYLSRHLEETKAYYEEGKLDVKVRYLKMKVESQPQQRAAFYNHPVLSGDEYRPASIIKFVCRTKLGSSEAALVKQYERDAVANISPSKIPLLDPHQIPWLPDNLVKQIPNFLVRHVSKEQVPYLDFQQIRYLAKPEQVNAITPQHYSLLTSSQIEFLEKEKIPAFAKECPDKIPALCANQLTALPAEAEFIRMVPDSKLRFLPAQEAHLKLIPAEKFKFLNPDQIKALPPNRIPELTAHFPEGVKYLETEELIAQVPLEKIELLIERQFQFLSNEQVRALDPSRVHLLVRQAPKKLEHLESEEQILKVDVSKLNYLANRQLKYLSRKQVEALDSNRVVALISVAAEKLKFLNGPEQIGEVPDKHIQDLEDEQLKFLSSKQIETLDPARVPALAQEAPESLVHLKGSAQVKQVSVESLNQLSDEQLKLISPEQVAALDPSRVEALAKEAPEKLKHLTGKEQIEKVPQDRVNNLVEGQLKHLTSEQIAVLDPTKVPALFKEGPESLLHLATLEQVQAIPPEAVSFLADPMLAHLPLEARYRDQVPNEKLKYLSNEQIGALEPSRVPALAVHALEKLEHLITKAQIEEVPEKFLIHVKDKVFLMLNLEEVGDFVKKRKEFIPFLNKPELVQRVPLECIDHLTDEQLKFLSPEQVTALDPSRVEALAKQAPESLVHLLSKRQIRQIPARSEYLKYVQKNGVKFVDDSAVPHLEKEQLAHLKPKRYRAITPLQSRDVKDEHLKYLPKKEQLDQVEWNRFNHLTKEQLKTRYPSLLQRIGLIVAGAFFWICRLVLLVTGLHVLGYCIPPFRKMTTALQNESPALSYGMRTLCC